MGGFGGPGARAARKPPSGNVFFAFPAPPDYL